jgi:hypothetical protein
MTKMPRFVSIVSILAGVIMIAAGVATYALITRELKDENITVSEDAENFAGDPVENPWTAYSEAMVIKEHALEIGGGKTYAELDQDDPARATVQTASFLRASLFTSVVSYGVAVLVAGLGLLFILVGMAIWGLDKKANVRRLAGIPPEAVFRDDAYSTVAGETPPAQDVSAREPGWGTETASPTETVAVPPPPPGTTTL